MHARHTTYADASELGQWVGELLDAHLDTAWLAANLVGEAQWQMHLQYLSDLQRRGREALARLHPDPRDASVLDS
jgi:hypothetical protein